MIAELIALFSNFFKSIPIFDKWFTKSIIEKEEDVKKDIAKEKEKFKEDGRPEW